MPLRLRLFEKKRGTRRTAARWQGIFGEAVLDTALLAVGVFGLYWLITAVLLRDERSGGWWPWLLLVIPVALVIYGGGGLVVLIWQSIASTERRAATAKKATDWELLARETPRGRLEYPAVPPIDDVVDSPGTRLAYRLPIDAASGWVLLIMALICVAWNALVAVFVVQVVRQHVAGEPNWLLTWLMVPFVLAGLWTLVVLARQLLLWFVVGTTRLEVSDHPFHAGDRYEAFVSQTGRLNVRWLQVQLLCEEQAVFQQGTDTRVAREHVCRETLFSARKFDIAPGQPFEQAFSFAVPVAAMHSFASSHNAVTWTLAVRGRLARWGEIDRRFPIYVYPSAR